jgi:hypothetical protein
MRVDTVHGVAICGHQVARGWPLHETPVRVACGRSCSSSRRWRTTRRSKAELKLPPSRPLSDRLRKMELEQLLAERGRPADCVLEINAGAGGVDAMDWCLMLLRMYTRWAERRGFTTKLLRPDRRRGGGAQERLPLKSRGLYAFGYLKAENGVHRLVRISPFDANARRQTAFSGGERGARARRRDRDRGEGHDYRPSTPSARAARAGRTSTRSRRPSASRTSPRAWW